MLFIYIYNPGWRIINNYTILLTFSLFVIVNNRKTYFKLIQSKRIMIVLISLIPIILYSLFTEIVNLMTNEPAMIRNTYFFRYFELFLHCIIILPAFVLFLYKRTQSLFRLNVYLIYISIAQSIITSILFISSEIKSFIFNHIINYDYLFQGVNIQNESLLYLRLNGIGSELTFAYSIFQGFCIFLILNLYVARQANYLFWIPLMLFSAGINARIGLILPLLSIILYVINSFFKNDKRLYTSIFKISLSLSFIFLFIRIPSELINYTFIVLRNGFTPGSVIPHQEILLNDFIIFPSTITGLFFGEGVYSLGNPDYNLRSDNGYVNFIMFGGFTLLGMALIWYILILKEILKALNLKSILTFTFIVSLLFIEIKGNILGLNGFTKSLLIIYFFNAIIASKKSNTKFISNV